MGLSDSIGIDLGTSNVLIYIKGKGIVLKEPAVVAVDEITEEIMAVGEKARQMLGKTPANVIAVKPIRNGVISDYEATAHMIKYFLKKTCGLGRFLKPKVIVSVPSEVTDVEKRAVSEILTELGSREIFLVEGPLAAAIGHGVAVNAPDGILIVDIGAGTTDIAVIASSGIVVNKTLELAGNEFDNAIVDFAKKKYKTFIGKGTAEELKINLGASVDRFEDEFICHGRDLITGLPKDFEITNIEIKEALKEHFQEISDGVHEIFEKTPPELIADITKKGIVLVGGGALVDGLAEKIQEETGVKVLIAEEPIYTIASGTGKAMENMDIIERSKLNRKRKNFI